VPYIDPKIIAEAKQMDLLTYLRNYEPEELIHVSGGEYTTRTHDSLRISDNGLWNWCSRGFGGHNALEYLIQVKGLTFFSAVETIVGRVLEMSPVFTPKTEKKSKTLLLPPSASNSDRVIQYLTSRGIDREIINHCIDNGSLYQGIYKTESGRVFNQCVFVGFDKERNKRYANIRGIGTDYKGDTKGSDKRYSFTMDSKRQNKTVHVFESAIDALSFATILKMNKNDWRNDNYLSLAGIYIPKSGKPPLALTQYLLDRPYINDLHLHLDKDAPGRAASEAIMAALQSDKYSVLNAPIPGGKDVNERLCRDKGIKINSAERKNEVR